MAIRHVLNPPAITALGHPGGSVARDMLRRAIRVQTQAKRNCRVDTGRLRSSISVEQTVRGGTVVTSVGTNVEYAIYVHNGTRYIRGDFFLTRALSAARG